MSADITFQISQISKISKVGNTSHLLRTLVALVACGMLLTGCATPGRTTSNDPFAKMNRGIYKFNDGLDRAILKPTAQGYKAITPNWFRTATGHFFENLSYPITMVNQLLQGKPKLFLMDTGRFITNSTLGLAGLFDVADKMGMRAHDEDFGQTLAVWGVPSGPYLTLPLIGPSSLRDGPAKIPSYLFGISRYTNISPAAELGLRGMELIDTRASLLSTDSTLDSAYDRYGILRDAWVQQREYLIYDGNPPEEKLEEYKDDEEEAKPKPKP